MPSQACITGMETELQVKTFRVGAGGFVRVDYGGHR